MARVTIQQTCGWIKLLWLGGFCSLWIFGPIIALAGNIDRGMTISGLGLVAIAIARIAKWMFNE